MLEGLALLIVIGLGLPGARVPGETGAAAAAERLAGRRRERGRDQVAQGPAEPGPEPESAPGREDAEPSRGGRLSRRAVAAAGRTGRAGGLRTAADRMSRRTRAAGRGRGTGRGGARHAGPERPWTRRTAQRAGRGQAGHRGCLPPLRTARKRGPHRRQRGRAGEGRRAGRRHEVRG